MPRWLAARNCLPLSPEEGTCAETHVYGVCCCPQVALCTVRGPPCETCGDADQESDAD